MNKDRNITVIVLLVLFAYSFLIWRLLKYQVGNDGTTYIGYLYGWMQDRYTYWYDVKDYLPDTFRNPGFPAVIGLIGLISTDMYFMQVFQFIFFCLTLVLVIRLIRLDIPNIKVVLIFAALVLLNPIVPFHIVVITPEIFTGLLIVSWLYIRIKWKDTWIKYMIIGLLIGFLFQVRPVLLFLPFIMFFVDWFLQRKNFLFLKQASVLLIYVASMMPYGYWNYKTHGVFSVTSLEGGGGVLHLGYWCLKMPGYYETRYWYNGAPVGIINFAKGGEVKKNIAAFEREWDFIDSSCAQYLTDVDRRNLPFMKAHPERFVTYNGRYTHEREKLLKKLSVQHYLEDWQYTIKIKIFTAFRLWVTGVPDYMLAAKDPASLAKAWVAPVTTGITLLLALIFIPLALFRKKISRSFWLPVLVTILYWGGIHIPFAIQARYTIPVRLLLFAMIAASVYGLYFKKEKGKSS